MCAKVGEPDCAEEFRLDRFCLALHFFEQLASAPQIQAVAKELIQGEARRADRSRTVLHG
jgi:hypothetical protein